MENDELYPLRVKKNFDLPFLEGGGYNSKNSKSHYICTYVQKEGGKFLKNMGDEKKNKGVKLDRLYFCSSDNEMRHQK